jgi:hypothetical protein
VNLTNISRHYLGINKMKIDLTIGTWQDNPGCPINITSVSTSDGHFMKLAHLPPDVKVLVGGKDSPSSSKRD